MGLNRREFLAAAAGLPLGAATQPASRYTIGITSNTRGGWEDDVFRSFGEAREVGYRHVESFIQYFTPYWDKPEALAEKIAAIGVKFVTISNGPPLEVAFENPAKHQQLFADHLKLVRFIKHFGCTHLKINLGPRRPTGTTSEDLKHIASALNELGKRIHDEGVRFAPHAHMWSQFENRAEIDYVMSKTDPRYVGFTLDTGHITLAGIDPVELARTLGHRVVEFHVKDTKPENRGGAKMRIDRPDMMKDPPFFELGHGGVDFSALKAHCDKIGWKGFWTVELDSSPVHGPKKSAMMSRDYLTKKLGLAL